MKPAVFRPASASRVRCSIGSRTSACTPLMKARPVSSAYLSSSDTVSRALRMLSGKGAFMGASPGAGRQKREPVYGKGSAMCLLYACRGARLRKQCCCTCRRGEPVLPRTQKSGKPDAKPGARAPSPPREAEAREAGGLDRFHIPLLGGLQPDAPPT